MHKPDSDTNPGATPSSSSNSSWFGCPRAKQSSPTSSEKDATPVNPASACPRAGGNLQSTEENIDPRNMMPVIANKVVGDEEADLSSGRERSNIPKTGSDENWVYPSPLQFYHALRRKNKDPDNDSDTMDAVVFAHNVTNEMTWDDIMKYERMHYEQCKDISLLRFIGRNDDLTIKGRFSSWFLSKGRPFDRHDWYVDRCGQSIRYIIDYYDDTSAKNDVDVSLDTRPALDSFSNLWDRIRFNWYKDDTQGE